MNIINIIIIIIIDGSEKRNRQLWLLNFRIRMFVKKRSTIKAVAFSCGPILKNEWLSRLSFANSLRTSSPFGGYREKQERIKFFSIY